MAINVVFEEKKQKSVLSKDNNVIKGTVSQDRCQDEPMEQ
jgi:hypothetical protein